MQVTAGANRQKYEPTVPQIPWAGTLQSRNCCTLEARLRPGFPERVPRKAQQKPSLADQQGLSDIPVMALRSTATVSNKTNLSIRLLQILKDERKRVLVGTVRGPVRVSSATGGLFLAETSLDKAVREGATFDFCLNPDQRWPFQLCHDVRASWR